MHDVIEAIEELHTTGLAHQDLRLENVCFNVDDHAVLIDLDRAVKVDGYPYFTTKSTMYT